MQEGVLVKRLVTRRGSILGLILTLAAPSSVLAYRSGPPPGVNGSTASGGASCRICHGNSAGSGSVQIIGFPAQYARGSLYPIQVRVADPVKSGAGFQISFETTTGAHAGMANVSDAGNTQFSGVGWVYHTSSGVNNSILNWASMGNAAVYNLSWTAPSVDVGPVTAWAAGNAINNNFSNSGDIIYLTSVRAGPPTGACCDASTGTCTDGTPSGDCAGGGRSYGGDGSTCVTLSPPCTILTGACCDDVSGECTENETELACETAGNLWGGAGSTCALLDPPCTAAPSGCCDGATGQCTEGLTAEACADLGDQTTYYEHIPCALLGEPGFPPRCERHRGACCDHSPGAGGPDDLGLCMDGRYPEDCAGAQQTWVKGLLCADLECLETTGACCNTLLSICTDDTLAAECSGAQRVWTVGESCADVPCDATLGACCDQDPFGGCTETTYAQCQCFMCVWHKLRTCGQIECVHNPIPTMSQWGVVVLTLLLLTAAKVYFGRRSAEGVGSGPPRG